MTEKQLIKSKISLLKIKLEKLKEKLQNVKKENIDMKIKLLEGMKEIEKIMSNIKKDKYSEVEGKDQFVYLCNECQ